MGAWLLHEATSRSSDISQPQCRVETGSSVPISTEGPHELRRGSWLLALA